MTRDDLAARARGIGAELGVAGGDYSLSLLRYGTLDKLYSIDRWSDHHDEAEYRRAVRRLGAYGERSVIVRKTFADALTDFADEFFDFIYIDGYAHTGQDGGRTLRDWWPKLKPGGIFAGHDYDPQYPLTIKAVDEFAGMMSLKLRVTDEESCPSWFAETAKAV